MNEPRDYTPRNHTVQALQYDGENDAAVALFAGPVQRNVRLEALIELPGVGYSVWLPIGDWIVKSGDTFRVMSAVEFAMTYKAVTA